MFQDEVELDAALSEPTAGVIETMARLDGEIVLLGAAGKIGGGYLGARWGRQPAPVALRVGALMNTRGLTELIVLQVGYTAGILTAPLFLALVVMALVTTAMTGPLLSLIDRHQARLATTVPVAGIGTGTR